jgi:penicillin-binding protein 2
MSRRPTNNKDRTFTRRAVLLTAGKIALLGTLGARLYNLQIVDGQKYREMAEGNRIRLLPTIPKRGRFIDRTGKIIADGNIRYQLYFDPQSGMDKVANIEKICTIMKLSEERRAELLAAVKSRQTRYPLLIDNYLDWDKIATFSVNSNEVEGTDIVFTESRIYNYGDVGGNVLGYVGPINEYTDEIKQKYGALYSHPDFRIGKTGLEYSREDQLAGRPGVRQVEVDARGKVVRELASQKHEPGQDIKLALDIEIQEVAMNALRGKGGLDKESGSVVVIDVDTGDVICMVSAPSYDPTIFARGIKPDEWKEIMQSKDKPLLLRPIGVEYPPGSTFKIVVATAALEEGVINTSTHFQCTGKLWFGNRFYHCWYKEGHGFMNIARGLAQSCNIFFYETSRLLGPNKIAEYSRKLGLGELSGIELPGEKKGIIPDKKWKKEVLKQPWYDGETLNFGIGQGFTLTTPLQMAIAAARIASGKKVQPRMVIENNEIFEEFEALEGISPKTLEIVRKCMEMVVNDPLGTVYRHRIMEPEFRFAGKTGTAQVVSNRFEKMPDQSKQKYHAHFVGYAPVNRPKYAISVTIEHGGFGSTAAAPVAREVLLALQKKMAGEINQAIQKDQEELPWKSQQTNFLDPANPAATERVPINQNAGGAVVPPSDPNVMQFDPQTGQQIYPQNPNDMQFIDPSINPGSPAAAPIIDN